MPARAWHSHEIGIGRTGKRGSEKDEEERKSEALGKSQGNNRKKSQVKGKQRSVAEQSVFIGGGSRIFQAREGRGQKDKEQIKIL